MQEGKAEKESVEDLPRPWEVGAAIEVFSRGEQAWLPGIVLLVRSDGTHELQYGKDLDMSKSVALDELTTFVRASEEAKKAKPKKKRPFGIRSFGFGSFRRSGRGKEGENEEAVRVKVAAGPLGLRIRAGPGAMGLQVVGFQEVSGQPGPVEADGRVRVGMTLLQIDDDDVSASAVICLASLTWPCPGPVPAAPIAIRLAGMERRRLDAPRFHLSVRLLATDVARRLCRFG